MPSAAMCLAAEAIFADDTPVSMLAPGTGKTQTARLWAYARDERPWGGTAAPAAWYRLSGDRKGQHPKDHLARYRGWMHADGYAGLIDLYRSGAVREVARHWPMCGASSPTSTGRRALRSPKRPSAGSLNSMPSRRRPETPYLIAALSCDAATRPRSSTIWSDGWPCNSPRSRANPHSRLPSAMC